MEINKTNLKKNYSKKLAMSIVDRAENKVLDTDTKRLVAALREVFNYKPDKVYIVKSI